MGRGTVYPFIADHLLGYVRRSSRVLETGCGAAKYRGIVHSRGAVYLGTDVPNEHYQDAGDVDVFCSSDSLPFAAGSFEAVFNQGAIDYMPQIEVTLAEAFRVLKRRGVLIVYTYDKTTLEQIHDNCLRSGRSWERHHRVFSEDELMRLMTDAGFAVADETGRLNTWSPDSFWEGMRMRWTGELERRRRAHSIWRVFVGRKG